MISSSFATTANDHYDNSSVHILTTHQPATATSIQIYFNYYVDGLYGNDCVARIVNFGETYKLEISYDDLYCACYGDCAPPLSPNPKAIAWIQAQIQARNYVTSVLTYFQTYAVFIFITGLVVILGSVGKHSIN